jgi:hypothetical protein
MKLVLNCDARQIECIDWLTALVGLKTIPDATSVQRVGVVPWGKVAYLWKSRRNGTYSAFCSHIPHQVRAEPIIAQIEAGEDV